MNTLSLGVLFPVLAAAAHAQTVTASLAAATPFTASVTVGGVTTQVTQPAGPLPNQGLLYTNHGAPTPFLVESFVDWVTGQVPRGTAVELRHQLLADFMPSTTVTATSEMVVTFTASAAAPAKIMFNAWSNLSPGAPQPQVAVDLGNDGSIEFTNLANWGPQLAQLAVLGPTPVTLRVIMTSQVAGPGHSSTTFELWALPYNNLSIAQNAVACSAGSAEMPEPVPVFADRGIDLVAVPSGSTLGVFVLGLNLQPLLLPPQQGLPCLLTPSPDIVLFVPTNQVRVPLPAAVRPVTLHAQWVAVTATGLAVTEGWTIAAW